MSEKIQYTFVALIVFGALVWIVVSFIKTTRRKSSGCSCCPLEKTCNGKKDVSRDKCDNITKTNNNHEQNNS